MSRASKFLSLVLRHAPDKAHVKLDPQGWVAVDDLLRGLKRAGRPMSRADLEILVASNDKQRFTLSCDHKRIRAAQGHSIPVDLGLEPLAPPRTLFHGTARSNFDAIFNSGLLPSGRLQVHLSTDPDTALLVGQRHGTARVLTVDSGLMHLDGFIFTRADNGVWLTDHVPPLYLGFWTPG